MDINIMDTYLPLYITNIKKGHGSFITIDLCETQNPDTSYLHLWIYLTDWYFIKEGATKSILDFATVADDNFKDLSSVLLNNRLREFKILYKDMIELVFDNNFRLILVADLDCYAEDDDLFMLFDDMKNIVISYSPSKALYIEKKELEHRNSL